jgi:hypothetical protein
VVRQLFSPTVRWSDSSIVRHNVVVDFNEVEETITFLKNGKAADSMNIILQVNILNLVALP